MKKTDVIIVGAGLAGLSAARELIKLNKKVTVLEARDRMGGRTHSVATITGEVIDVGGQWLGPDQNHMHALVKEFGLKTIPQNSDGKKIIDFNKKLREYSGTIPKLGIHVLLDLQWAIHKLSHLMKSIPLDTPQFAFAAKKYDGMTVETWKNENLWFEQTKKMFDVAVVAIFAADPAEISFLHFLFYLHSGGGLENLIETKGGAQDCRIEGGAQQVSERLAANIGSNLHLSNPVEAVQQVTDGVAVLAGGEIYEAKYVVLAIPPFLLNKITFDPPLSTHRQQMLQRFPMGSVIKCIALYKSPFWRKAGYCGEAICDDGPVQFMFDDTPNAGEPGALVGFINANNARKWGQVSQDIRKQVVLKQFARYFGAEALQPIEYTDLDWSAEQYSAGCYVGLFPPNGMTEYGELIRKPEGRIHWAGTETASRWNGYMDGAVESGLRVAKELAELL